jgi:large subunit ribosomal protein L31
MKKDIHPDYKEVVFQDVQSDFKFLTRSTMSSDETIKWEDGKEYPLIKVEVSSASHPFYTGKKIFVDTAGRVEKFNQKYKAKQSAKPAAETKPVQEEPAKPASAEEVAPEVNDTPAEEKAKEETPKAEDVKAEAPAEEAKEETPAAEEVKEETPKAEEVKAEAPSEEESKEEAPAEEEPKEETPKAEEVKEEEPPAVEEVKEKTPKAENKEEEGDKEKEN